MTSEFTEKTFSNFSVDFERKLKDLMQLVEKNTEQKPSHLEALSRKQEEQPSSTVQAKLDKIELQKQLDLKPEVDELDDAIQLPQEGIHYKIFHLAGKGRTVRGYGLIRADWDLQEPIAIPEPPRFMFLVRNLHDVQQKRHEYFLTDDIWVVSYKRPTTQILQGDILEYNSEKPLLPMAIVENHRHIANWTHSVKATVHDPRRVSSHHLHGIAVRIVNPYDQSKFTFPQRWNTGYHTELKHGSPVRVNFEFLEPGAYYTDRFYFPLKFQKPGDKFVNCCVVHANGRKFLPTAISCEFEEVTRATSSTTTP